MCAKKQQYVFLNNKIVPKEEAKISCFDEGVTHGWAVYEGLRVYNGKIILLKEHIERLFDSAKAACIKIPLTKEELSSAIFDTVKYNGFKNCHIRPWVSFGEKGGSPNLFIQVSERESEMGKPLTSLVSSFRRTSCDSIDAKIKTSSRLDVCLASIEAEKMGVDVSIMLDKDGFISDVAPGASIFLVKNGKIYTPFTTNCLSSITREILLKLFRASGYNAEEKNLTFQDLYSADEIFIAGTAAEIKPIISVGGRKINDGKIGPIVDSAIKMYKEFIEKEGRTIF
jgi:branched-chain amino acid aminotransferase